MRENTKKRNATNDDRFEESEKKYVPLDGFPDILIAEGSMLGLGIEAGFCSICGGVIQLSSEQIAKRKKGKKITVICKDCMKVPKSRRRKLGYFKT